jgi:hypothetical protein
VLSPWRANQKVPLLLTVHSTPLRMPTRSELGL